MFKRLIAAAAVFGMTALAPPLVAASNQPKCGPRDAIVTALQKTYGEARTGAGLQGQSGVFELWVSKKTEAWTITRTQPNGVTCVMAVGEHWMAIDEPQGVQS